MEFNTEKVWNLFLKHKDRKVRKLAFLLEMNNDKALVILEDILIFMAKIADISVDAMWNYFEKHEDYEVRDLAVLLDEKETNKNLSANDIMSDLASQYNEDQDGVF